ncbi:STAS domain-containing protein [Streptomyces lunaelactis]|uniref:STAS domain-containing protein n=1 Tax=Streptomyces lunaelactis TaxID=1535768 RepID=A0A2R4SVK7_9ACTN|nr:STAS domain-containing protein [Streptomyces lunaelactis]AVZ70913.1 STAS domain-containing protein [Streptomyces lunaelactis]AVZ76322.1 STAS domain-containing protein [Streptomyces lunaelactis]NUK09930.1 STAS domain-containing protein [Streptomyces lunaelactis]NUK25169.1 STAS domain-containing protein [Streptomyces lunaelactis]NUK72760.1 STAS domain-containing protein [Streptomyces lunaelactis]
MRTRWPALLENCRLESPAGELDLASAPAFGALLWGMDAQAGADWLIVDLRAVTFMDCSPLHDLCAAWDRSEVTGRWTRVVYDQDRIGQLLRLTSLLERFPRYASIEDAWRHQPIASLRDD